MNNRVKVIICEDTEEYLHKVEQIVKKNFIDKSEIVLFSDYNSNFFEYIKSLSEPVIYILDVEVPTMSGIDVAKRIRKNDYKSIIIFITGYNDLDTLVSRNNIMALNYINKFDSMKKNLINSLSLAFSMLGQEYILSLNYGNICYRINTKNILYITRDTFIRKVRIVCDNSEHTVNDSLSGLLKMLPNYFEKTHRACIVNTNRVIKYDYNNKLIEFDNGSTCNLLSKRYQV